MSENTRVIGVSGETGTGKTLLGVYLTRHYGAVYCSIGEVYLALVEHAVSLQGAALYYPFPRQVVDCAIDALEDMTLRPSMRMIMGESCRTVVPNGKRYDLNINKSDMNVRRVYEFVVRQDARNAILEYLREQFRILAYSVIILDGRESFMIAEKTIFLDAPFEDRVHAVMQRTGQLYSNAYAFVLDADDRDRFMNAAARDHHTTRIMATSSNEILTQKVSRAILVLDKIGNKA